MLLGRFLGKDGRNAVASLGSQMEQDRRKGRHFSDRQAIGFVYGNKSKRQENRRYKHASSHLRKRPFPLWDRSTSTPPGPPPTSPDSSG